MWDLISDKLYQEFKKENLNITFTEFLRDYLRC